MPETTRSNWIDVFRGLGIILVVAGHVIGGLEKSPFITEVDRLQAIYGWIYSFHMAALFFASGLFVDSSLKKHGTQKFILDKIRTLVYPMYLWSAITWLVHGMMQNYTNTPFNPRGLINILLNPLMGYWFLVVLFAYMAVYALLNQVRGGRWIFHLLAIGLYIGNIVFEFPPSIASLKTFARYSLYFSLGTLGARQILKLAESISTRQSAALAAIGLGIVTTFAPTQMPVYVTWQSMWLGLAGIIGLFGFSITLSRFLTVKSLIWCGQHSLEIYLVSGIPSVAARILLRRLLGVTSLTPHLIGGILAGLLGTFVLVWFAQRIGLRHLFRWPASATNPPAESSPRVATTPS